MQMNSVGLDVKCALMRFHPAYWLAYLSVSMGFAAIYCLLSLQSMLLMHLNQTFGSVLFHTAVAGIYQPKNPLTFEAARQKLEPLMGTQALAIRSIPQPVSITGKPIGSSPVLVSEYLVQTLSLELESGRTFTSEDALSGKKLCMVGHHLGPLINQALPIALIDDVACEVIGVLKPATSNPFLDISINDAVFLPAYSALRFGQENEVQQILIVSDHRLSDIKILIEQAFSGYKIYWRDWSTFSQPLQTQQHQINRIVQTLSTMALFIAALNIMNVMGIQLKTRRCEFGLRKMLGLSDKEVIWRIWLEQTLLYLCLSAVGIMMGLLAIYFLSTGLGWYFAVQWGSVLACILVGLILAFIFSILLISPLKNNTIDVLMLNKT